MTGSPPRPTPELLAALRRGKEELHDAQRHLPMPEKVRRVVELQRLTIPQIARRRPLQYFERAWPTEEENE
jgi:hypothetical protein